MRNRKREQRLIRVITLLDGAELEQDRERIMDLLHSARRACREGDADAACQYSFNALRSLTALSGRLQASGTAAETLAPLATAVELLLPEDMTQERSLPAMFMAEPLAWRLAMLCIPLFSAGVIAGLWRLLNT